MNLFDEITRLRGPDSVSAVCKTCNVSRRKLYDFQHPALVAKMKLSTVQAVLATVNELRTAAGEPALTIADVI